VFFHPPLPCKQASRLPPCVSFVPANNPFLHFVSHQCACVIPLWSRRLWWFSELFHPQFPTLVRHIFIPSRCPLETSIYCVLCWIIPDGTLLTPVALPLYRALIKTFPQMCSFPLQIPFPRCSSFLCVLFTTSRPPCFVASLAPLSVHFFSFSCNAS